MTAKSMLMLPMVHLAARTTPRFQSCSVLHMLNLEEAHILDDCMPMY